MRKTIVLLGIVAGLLAPLSAHADPESLRAGDTGTRVKKTARTAAARARSDRATIYITNRSVTGSHLPLVVNQYRGETASMSPLSSYGRPDLDRTGQLAVGNELLQRDPAISSAFGASARR